MSNKATAELRFDGSCQGNPGPAGYGAVLDVDGEERTDNGSLGRSTNNQAEYEALIAGLELARESGVKLLQVRGDSELVIKQVTGDYRVRAENLQPLHGQAIHLAQEFEAIEFECIDRADNGQADKLARKARNLGAE